MNSFVAMDKGLKVILVLLWFGVSPTKATAQNATDTADVQEIVVFTTRGINASGARYHLDGCRYLKNGQIHIDERVALQRSLLPCSICLPERTAYLNQLRTKEVQPRKAVYRKCVFKTKSGAKCSRPASKDNRYCELHASRARKPRR
ncbi:MAG: hypothetical protein ACPG4S_03870 [Schleiferiaceae bacterium]|nr:MAG: Uncharacterised protein [Cryomorphaceae bacterium]